MQVMFVLGLELALSKLAPREITRIGFQDDITFIGFVAALNRSWWIIEGALAEAGRRLRGCRCVVWAPGFEQFEDMELPTEVRDLCVRVPRKRHGVSLLGSAANTQHCMHIGLDQPSEPPTQTVERVEKALATLQSTKRLACDQHDHVSFAKAWMLMSWGVAHALDHGFRLVPLAVMDLLQRLLEGGLRHTFPVFLGGVGLSAGMGASKTPHVLWWPGHRVAQMGFAAQATYWSAVDLHKAAMTSICDALNRPMREVHPEIAAALAAKIDLLVSGVAVGEHARVAIENEAGKLHEASPWAADKRSAEIVRRAPVQASDSVPPKSLARDMAFAKQPRGLRQRMCTLLKRLLQRRTNCNHQCQEA